MFPNVEKLEVYNECLCQFPNVYGAWTRKRLEMDDFKDNC